MGSTVWRVNGPEHACTVWGALSVHTLFGGGGVVTLGAPRCGGSDNSNFMPLLWL